MAKCLEVGKCDFQILNIRALVNCLHTLDTAPVFITEMSNATSTALKSTIRAPNKNKNTDEKTKSIKNESAIWDESESDAERGD